MAGTTLHAITAPDFTWSPSALTGEFNTAANWQGGVTPTSSSSSTALTFSSWSNAPATPIVTLASTFETNSITFNGSSVNYQLAGSGGASLKLGSGGITANGGATITLLNSLPILLLANQTWQATNATSLLVQGTISGAFSINKTGSYDMTLSGANTFSGGLTIAAGSLTLGSSSVGVAGAPTAGPVGVGLLTLYADTSLRISAGGAPVTLHNNILFNDNIDSIIDTTNGNLTLLGTISGSGGLNKIGTGSLTLSGANIFTGGTKVTTGTLSIGGGGAAGTITGNIAVSSAASLAFNRSDASTYAGILSGTGTLSKLGAGTLALTGANTYTGTTTVSGGTLSIGNGGTTGSFAGNIAVASSANLAFNRSDTSTYAGIVSGSGSLTKLGLGTLTLAGNNTYTGGTLLNAGTIEVTANSALGNSTGGLFFGGGGLNAASSFTTDRSITLNAGGGTLGASSGVSLITTGLISGSGTLAQVGAGTLVISGPNTYTGATLLSAGKLSISADSALGASPGTPTSAHLQFNGGTMQTTATFTLNPNRGITLGTGGGTLAPDLGTVLTYGGIIAGSGALNSSGAGTLVLTGNNTYTGGTTVAGGLGLRIGAGGTSGSVLGNIVLNGTNLTFDRSDAYTYAGVISGTGSVYKEGVGTLTLTGPSTYSSNSTLIGTTTINAGTLSVGSVNALPANGTVNIAAGATLDIAANQLIGLALGAGSINLASGKTLTINSSPFGSTLSGIIGGAGSLAKDGGATLQLSGANTYSGGTSLLNGNLYALNAAGSATGTGTVTIVAGKLNIGLLGTTGSIAGDIVNNGSYIPGFGTFGASVNFNRSDNTTYAGLISGTGAIEKNGAGTLTLTGNHTFTGQTLINTGTLQIGNGGTSGALVGTVGNNGTLAFNRSDNLSYGGVIFGSGNLSKLGLGTLTLSGASTYTGTTSINAGVLRVGTDNALPTAGTVSITGAATLDLASSQTLAGISGPALASVTIGTAKTLTLNATSSGLQFDGKISGAGSLAKTGNSSLNLTSDNTYTGGTTISAGTLTALNASGSATGSGVVTINGGALQIGGGGTVGSVAGNIVNNATLIFARFDNLTYGGVVSGSGSLSKTGAGTLTLTSQSTYGGNTTVTGGKLELDVVNALPTTTLLSLATGSILDVDANQTVAGFFGATGLGATLDLATGVTFTVAMPVANTSTTFAGSVTGGGVFAVSGAGGDVVNLTGSVTNTGGTLVGNGATLIIGSGGSVSGPITTTTGSVLTFNNTGTQTLNNIISGPGGISVTAGVTTLSGNNTYSGPTNITGGKLLLTGNNTGGGTITVGNGAVFGGTGFTNGPLVLNGGSAVSPGASPGILTVGATTFAGGARFAFEINSTSAAPGVGWDLLTISGALTITATPANPFIIDLTSLNLSNNAALLANFTNTNSYSWQFVATTGGVTGFSAGAFQYNASQFQNSLGAGHFFVSESSGNLFLNFTPVPEPSTYVLLALGLGVIVVLSRRRRS